MTKPDSSVAAMVDRLTQLDLSSRGAIDPIRRAVTEIHGVNTAMQAARHLDATIDEGDLVVIVTGFLIPPTYAPETDGPPGAIALARGIRDGLGGRPLILGEESVVEVCDAAGSAADLELSQTDSVVAGHDSVGVGVFPTHNGKAETFVDELLAHEPAAIVAIEKPSPNRAGRYHTMAGHDITDESAKVDTLFKAPEVAGGDILTVSVGDGGNEVGMGAIEATIRAEVPMGDVCDCPCKDGIAAAVQTDVLVPAAVSNWGAYGITTCLSSLTDSGGLLHSRETEAAMLEAISDGGAIDGITDELAASVDGLSSAVHESLVCLLRTLETRREEP